MHLREVNLVWLYIESRPAISSESTGRLAEKQLSQRVSFVQAELYG